MLEKKEGKSLKSKSADGQNKMVVREDEPELHPQVVTHYPQEDVGLLSASGHYSKLYRREKQRKCELSSPDHVCLASAAHVQRPCQNSAGGLNQS